MTLTAATVPALRLVLALPISAWVPLCLLYVNWRIECLFGIANARVGLSSPRRLPHAASTARRVE